MSHNDLTLIKNDDSSPCYDIIITHLKLKMSKFCDCDSSDVDYDSKTGLFGDVSYLKINQSEPRYSKGASGGHSVGQARS